MQSRPYSLDTAIHSAKKDTSSSTQILAKSFLDAIESSAKWLSYEKLTSEYHSISLWKGCMYQAVITTSTMKKLRSKKLHFLDMLSKSRPSGTFKLKKNEEKKNTTNWTKKKVRLTRNLELEAHVASIKGKNKQIRKRTIPCQETDPFPAGKRSVSSLILPLMMRWRPFESNVINGGA